tara:strand:- start:401 stop:679 length:279 start_codon:yes stop_codon:yes gene_type:complete
MKALKMDKANILELEIKKKIEFINDKIRNRVGLDSDTEKKIFSYTTVISSLKNENNNLKKELESLRHDQKLDSERIEELIKQLSELMENHDA